MKKQIWLFVFILSVIFCKGQNEDEKWSFGVGGGIYQAPKMQGEKVEDKYFDLEYYGGFTASRHLGKNKKHTLGVGLNYAHRTNRFECNPNGLLNNILYEDSLFVKIIGSYIVLNVEYKYEFFVKNTSFNIGVGAEFLSFPIRFSYMYKSQLLEYISVENFHGGFRKRPYLSLEKPIILFNKLKLNIALNLRFNFDKNTFLNRIFINSEIYTINVYDNFLTHGLVINFTL